MGCITAFKLDPESTHLQSFHKLEVVLDDLPCRVLGDSRHRSHNQQGADNAGLLTPNLDLEAPDVRPESPVQEPRGHGIGGERRFL